MTDSKPSSTPSSAVLLYDKPAGVSSHRALAGLRRELGYEPRRRRGRGVRMGHAGTLDPFATGLLVVLVGAATRLQRYLLELPKTYRATARLGWCSSTGDPDGELVETGRLPGRLELPVGRVRQRLPMTSAVRVDGERLYHRAHRGETVVTPEREIEVHATRLLGTSGARAEFEIVCSSGTYVRTLIETLGDAYCDELRRTAIGTMRVPGAGG
ncbi:MAG TPA: tRNA pseudouridine(55) synthase TruB, partial [Solirubrobacterales bacterium]|nr:tRNA pseudouridine(55) synthase TruB [Solirubrobacterales bacterium]